MTTIQVRRAREIAAEVSLTGVGPTGDFADATRPLRDDELQPLFQEVWELIEHYEVNGRECDARNARRLKDYVADEASRRGIRVL